MQFLELTEGNHGRPVLIGLDAIDFVETTPPTSRNDPHTVLRLRSGATLWVRESYDNVRRRLRVLLGDVADSSGEGDPEISLTQYKMPPPKLDSP